MMTAQLVKGRLRGRLCFDGERTYLEDTPEEIAAAVRPYLDRPLEYKTGEWIDGVRVKTVHVAQPNTPEHFSSLVWFYLPCKARISVAIAQGEEHEII